MEAVLEVCRTQPIEPVPGAPPFVLGVTRLRSRAVPVVDLAALLGLTAGATGRLVTLRVGDRRVALAVEDVVGVRIAAAIEALPPLLSPSPTVDALARLDGELVEVLAPGRALPPDLELPA